ncbi:polycomb group protein Psc-like [Macrosteles quadrilineatus]|uniref:polycomb group protein Psc-like n=1 Tax=Macrosteles quadrilineatus TaxID=74068 RepID=UPI0023E2F9A0|nr:polycomb group protein Psc-like [Macrosteles quadrilineatus]
MASSSSRSVKVTDLNPHLLCVLCGGYYVDATTIIECLHSFCKSCIVRYLETNKYCPICDVQVHKSKPLLNIRSDRKLQAIVYKLVPGLLQRELNCRKEFYKNQLDSKLSSSENVAAALEDSPVCSEGETFLLGVQYVDASAESHNKRYLRCPAAINVSILHKLMRAKFDLKDAQRVEFLYEGDLLPDHMSLVDLAYMYHWKRKDPIELEYRFLECQQKRIKLSHHDDNAGVEEKLNVEHEADREVQLQISETGVMSAQSVDSVEVTSVKDINLETMELVKSLGNQVTLTFDSSPANSKVKIKHEIPTNNNTITMESVSEAPKDVNCVKDVKEEASESKEIIVKKECPVKENTKDSINVNNNEPEKNKSHAINSSLSITVIPVGNRPTASTPVYRQKVYPGAVKDNSNQSKQFRVKETPNDTKRPEVTIKPTSEKPEFPKSGNAARYKTLKTPIKPWNPTIPRATIMAMKQAQAASQEKDPSKPSPKPPKFFKMRNVPRFLGNPASGVKPMYQVLPGSELPTSQPSLSQTSKSTPSSELTVMKIDPKTLNPISVPHPKSSKLNSSSSKPPVTFTPAHKPSERDSVSGVNPIRNPVSKSNLPSRGPSLAHSQSFPSSPFGLPSPHVLYPGFPRHFSPVDAAGNQLSADNQILRAMSMLCSPGAAFHPSLPPSISMLFNPHHPHHRSAPDKLNFKYNPSDFHKNATGTTTTPSVQRIPPSGPSSKISSPSPNSSFSESLSSPAVVKEEKHPAGEKSEAPSEESRSGSLVPSNEFKSKSTPPSSSTEQDNPLPRIGKTSPLPITNGLSSITKNNLDKEYLLKLHKQSASAKQCITEPAEQSKSADNQRDDSKKAVDNNNSS